MRAIFAIIAMTLVGCAPVTNQPKNVFRSFNVNQNSLCNPADQVTIKADGAWQGNLDVWVIPVDDSVSQSPLNNPNATRVSTLQKVGDTYSANIEAKQVTAAKNGSPGRYTLAVSDQNGAYSSTVLDVKSCQ
jgi:hypothetical protein